MEKKICQKREVQMNELERIAQHLGIKFEDCPSESLCVIIQEQVKTLVNKNKRLEFTNTMLKKQNECKNDTLKVCGEKIKRLESQLKAS